MKSPIHPDVEMKQVTRHGIVIDYCPVSGGVWLDKGELEKLMEFAATEAHNAPLSDTANAPLAQTEHHQQQEHHKKKKRENPLMDLFDFDFFG